MAEHSADYESESSDRKHLKLPRAANQLIQTVLDANPRTVSWEHSYPFCFGYGLSYTTFKYSALAVPSILKPSAERVGAISVNVKNTDLYDGAKRNKSISGLSVE
jgi:hypothetical protein